MLFFAVMLVLIRVAGQTLPVAEVVVARTVIMQAIILLQAGPAVRHILRTTNLRLQVIRGALSLGATWTSYVAVVYLPLALATGISFTYAIFVTIGAALFLRESVSWKRWTATLLGLAGVLIMIGPTEMGGLYYVVIAVAGAVCGAGMILSVRKLDPAESIGTVLTYQNILVLPVMIIPLLLTWQWPTPSEWMVLLAIGLIGTAGQWLLVSAYQLAEAAKLAPLDFVRLVLMTGFGLIFFGETLSPPLAIGMLLVVGTTIYTVRANAPGPLPERTT
jgi:drug/metabolite transporter (DMT)-like permease